jgi:D-alanine-D-alanine ligase
MKIGIAYDLKVDGPAPAGWPDDFQEEFDSPATLAAIAAALRGLGHEVQFLGNGRELLEQLLAQPPDFVFNFAEGHGVSRSREARVPAVLEMLGIPYTGSDPLTLAVGLDKDCAKRLVQSAGVAVPQGFLLRFQDRESLPLVVGQRSRFLFPYLLKPAWEGSSKGIRGKCLVDSPEQLIEVAEAIWRDHRQPILVEEYIQGDELTVGMIGNDPPSVLGIMRVIPQRATDRFVYSLEVKRDYEALVSYEVPARLPAAVTTAVREAALSAYAALGCRDVSRIDFRLRDGIPYFLEVNPLPGLNPASSDLVILARRCGWSYEQLIAAILEAARARTAHQETDGLPTAQAGCL